MFELHFSIIYHIIIQVHTVSINVNCVIFDSVSLTLIIFITFISHIINVKNH